MTMRPAAKVYIILAYTFLAAIAYLLDPKSSLLSMPYAFAVSRLLASAAPNLLVENIVLVWPARGEGSPFIVRFDDVCVGIYLLILVVFFLWLRGSSRLMIASAGLILFAVNTMRVVAVILTLHWYGYVAGAIVHDIFYATLTLLGIGVMVYSAYPFLRPVLEAFQRTSQERFQ
jgi:hypothetical protein